jgi:hypothetical protein
MPRNRHVIQVSTSTTLTPVHNTILCNQSTPITLTLPLPTANGINYKINRNDNVLANAVTLNAGVNPIINGISSSSTFIISPQTYTEITSLDNKWYIIYNVLTNPLDLYGVFSSTFVANNSTPYLPLSGSEAINVALIPYSPVVSKPSFMSVTVNWVSGTPSGNFFLSGIVSTFVDRVSDIPISLSSASPTTSIFTAPVTAYPNGVIIYLRLTWSGNSGSNDKFGLSFVRLS